MSWSPRNARLQVWTLSGCIKSCQAEDVDQRDSTDGLAVLLDQGNEFHRNLLGLLENDRVKRSCEWSGSGLFWVMWVRIARVCVDLWEFARILREESFVERYKNVIKFSGFELRKIFGREYWYLFKVITDSRFQIQLLEVVLTHQFAYYNIYVQVY